VEEHRRERDRHHGLSHQYDGRDLHGRAPLKRAHLAEHAEPVEDRAGESPRRGREQVTLMDLVGDQSARDAPRGERHAGGEHGHDRHVAPDQPEQVRRGGHRPEPADADGERDAPDVVVVDPGGDGRDARDAGDDRRAGQQVAPRDGLMEVVLAQCEQHEDPEGEGGLDDHDGGQQERHDLERPAQHGEPGPREPAPAAHQPRDEREAQRVLGRHVACLHGLHRHAQRKERCRDGSHRDACQERHHWVR